MKELYAHPKALKLGDISINPVTPDTQAPTAPTNLSAPSKTSSSVSLSWTASSDNIGVSLYNIYQATALIGTSSTTTFNATGLAGATAYTFSVKAKDLSGNLSASSNSVTVTTAPVGNVTVNDATVGTGFNQFEYSGTWNTSTGSTKFSGDDHYSSTVNSFYQVDFQGTKVEIYSTKATHHGLAAVSIDGGAEVDVDFYAATRADNTLIWTSPVLSNGNHTLKVRVKGTKNASSTGHTIVADRLEIYATSVDTQAPSAPTNLSSPAKTGTTINLTWSASTDNVGVTSYEIYKGGILAGTSTSTSYQVTGLSSATSYSFTVKAKDAANNVSAASSALSVTTLDVTAPSSPQSVNSTVVTATSIKLGWVASTDNVGVVSYEVLKGGVSSGTTTSTSFDVTGLSPNTSYTFTVTAKDAAGNVSQSSTGYTVITLATQSTSINDNQFTYTGSWNMSSGTGKYNSDDHYSNVTNNAYSYSFTGSRVKLYASKAPHHGMAGVSIDNGPEVTVDFYAAARQNEVLIWTSPVLANGLHTIKVRVKGTKHASSTGYTIVADRLDIESLAVASASRMLFEEEKMEDSKELTIFPNPAKDKLNVSYVSAEDSKVTISIVDLSAFSHITKEVQVKKGINSIELNLAHLKNGHYILSLSDSSGGKTWKKILIGN